MPEVGRVGAADLARRAGHDQAALVYFFSQFRVRHARSKRHAYLLAFSIVYFVYGVLASLAVGGSRVRRSRRSYGTLARLRLWPSPSRSR